MTFYTDVYICDINEIGRRYPGASNITFPTDTDNIMIKKVKRRRATIKKTPLHVKPMTPTKQRLNHVVLKGE